MICDFEGTISSCTCAGLVEYYILTTTLHIRIAILRRTIVLTSQNTTELDSTIDAISTLEILLTSFSDVHVCKSIYNLIEFYSKLTTILQNTY